MQAKATRTSANAVSIRVNPPEHMTLVESTPALKDLNDDDHDALVTCSAP
jgi:hypothetical protein